MISRPLFLLTVLVAFSLPVASHAAWVDEGFPVASATGQQIYPVIVSDGSGGAIIAWQDSRGSDFNIYVQRINMEGVAMWLPNGVPMCTATGDQLAPQIVSDGAGGAIVVWYDFRNGTDNNIYARRVNNVGALQWAADGAAVCSAPDDQTNALVTLDGSGGAIIAWDDSRNGLDYNSYVQRINSNGDAIYAADGVSACLAPGNQFLTSLVPNGTGAAIAVWYDYRNLFDADVYAQRINAVGGSTWVADGLALCTAIGDQESPCAVSDGSGGAIVAWTDRRGPAYDVYAQHVAAAGTLAWVSDGLVVCNATGNQTFPGITTDGSDGAIISWQDARNGAAALDIYAQRMTGAGAAQWTGNGVAVCSALTNQDHPVLTSDGSGGAIIVWNDARNGNPDIFAQRLNASGSPQWTSNGEPLVDASARQASTALTAVSGGGAIFTWQDFRSDVKGDVYAARFTGSGSTPSSVNGATPSLVMLGENYPNPFSGATTFDLTLHQESTVKAEVFDVAGHRVRTMDMGHRGAGASQLVFDGLGERATPLPSGVYFLRVRAGSEIVTRKMVLAR